MHTKCKVRISKWITGGRVYVRKLSDFELRGQEDKVFHHIEKRTLGFEAHT